MILVVSSFFSVDDWLKNFENKVKPFVELKDKLDETAAKKMGIKDPEAYPLVYYHFQCLEVSEAICFL